MTDPTTPETAILLTPLGRDAAVATAMLSEVGIVARAVDSVDSLVEQLAFGAGLVIVTEEALRDADLRGLSQWLAAQPEWSDLPFILLTTQSGGLERNPAAVRHLNTLGNVTFLERPFHPTTLVSLARAALRARRRQYEARARLETIRQGEEQLRVALSAGRLGAWSITVADRILHCSAQCRAHYGRGPDDPFSYEDLLASIHPEDRARVDEAIRLSLRGEADYDIEYRCIWPTGQIEWVHVRGRVDAMSDSGPVSMSGVSHGITERKTAEAGLLRSEERFRAAVAAVQGVVWTNTAEGEMRGEQPGWAALTGQDLDAYQGYGWTSAVHPADAQPTVDAWQVALAERRTFVFEHRLRVASGEWRTFAVRAVPALRTDGTIREWVGVHTDITHERETERALADLADSLEARVVAATAELTTSEARLRSIFESSFQYFIELSLDGVVLDANSTSLAGIACSREDVVGRRFPDTPWFAATPGAPQLIDRAITRAVGTGTVRQEITIDLPVGTRTFDLSIRAVRGGDGDAVALVVEAIDMTDRREAEERLLQSQKLETIGQLTGGVAHDFNNLLTPIVGSLELLRAKLGDDQRAHRWAEAGLQSAERARVLVDRLLSFARRQALEAVAVDVAALVQGMRELIGRSIGPTIEVDVVAADDLPPALVDPNQLELSILNLCINARDAMPEGGRVSISVGMDVQATPFDGAERGDFIRVSVADTGTGMSAETRAKAIEPFYTTKGIGKGTGLGLSMVHGLAGQLGGGMAIDSVLGEGTRITVWLPVACGEITSRDDTASDTFTRPTRGARVLLVDDDDLVRFAATDVLRDAGYDVVDAASGAEAMRLIAAGLEPHVLVTDQLMPGMKGTELAGELVKRHPHMAVLIATGFSDLPNIPFPRIAKPFASTHLVERVRLLVETPGTA